MATPAIVTELVKNFADECGFDNTNPETVEYLTEFFKKSFNAGITTATEFYSGIAERRAIVLGQHCEENQAKMTRDTYIFTQGAISASSRIKAHIRQSNLKMK